MSKYICFVWCILRYFCEYYVSAINFSSFLLTWSAVNGNILCFFAISAKAREGRFRSWTRKYYSILNERFLECKICQCYLKRSSGNTKGNINRHIKLKHPYVYFNEAHSKTICRDDKGGRKPIAQVFLSTNELAKNQLEENDSASLEHEPHVSNIDRSEDEAPDDENTPVVKLSEAELKIVEELNKKAMRRKRTKKSPYYSWTRKYYIRINEKFIKCKICRKSFKTNIASTGNVRRHIRVKHKDIYLKETQALPEVSQPSHNDKSDAKEYLVILGRDKTKKRPYYSWTRKYYTRINENFIKCKICRNIFRTDIASTSNVRRHIKAKHKNIYLKETQALPEVSQPSPNDVSDANEINEDEKESHSKESVTIESRDNEVQDKMFGVEEAESDNISEEVEKRRAHYSWTRKYYVRMNDKFIKCKICRRSYKTNAASTGNVRRHIRVKHNDIYLKETQLPEVARNDKSDANESTEDEKESDVVDEPIKITRRDGKIKSWTRKYYQKINDRLIMCLICQKFLRMNIHRHIKQRHPAIYLKENPTTVESTAVSKQDEDMIRNLCEKTSAGTRMSKSCIWNFFETVEHDRLYKCCFCTKTIVILPKKMHNLKRHISTCHEKEYQLILKYSNGDRDVEPSISDDRETASINQVPAVTSVEIAFLSIDGTGGRYKCSCCEEIIESTAEEAEAVLIQHVQICQLKPQDDTDAAVLESVDAPDLLD
ncbi:uncharacterized protein LOC112050199 isoform X1 [Bicyclus anynana]|uniref:Uncharacterized protein LOC112050199 isoform X1 n=1 Tax=Bicyclus anynana TaxID=110368 RepID=A0A6J1NM02_BICAN|nr:uncharacterized protein LOC112050199 isoform X1 [Bicyclus anynana]